MSEVAPRQMASDTSHRLIVAMDSISKSFGQNRVLSDVNFDVREGEVHALLGENGAGKSTLMKILMGVHQADLGRIILDGEDVSALQLRERLDRGIAMIFQELSVLPNRSVAENLFMTREPQASGWRIDDRRMQRDAKALIERFGFGLDPLARVGSLGFAQRQMVEILKAISRGAKLLIMDEPTSSLTIREEDTLFSTIGQLRAEGIGIVYISHRMADVLRLSDRISIVKDGQIVGPLDPASTSIDTISTLMSKTRVDGKAVTDDGRKGAPRQGQAALVVDELKTDRKFSGLSFAVQPGEIVGLAGLVGSGRSTLAKAVFGLIPDARGKVSVGGHQLGLGDPVAAVKAGVGLVPEDRRLEGLVGGMALDGNLALPSLPSFTTAAGIGPVAMGRIGALFRHYRRDLGIVCRGPRQIANELSGGNQQKIVFAKWLATKPKLLILDEPTSGVDINAKRDMRDLVRRTAAEGVGVLLISSELEELIDLCDRILVLANGRLTRSLDRVEGEVALRSALQIDAARVSSDTSPEGLSV